MADGKPPRHPREYGGSGKIENPDDGTPIRVTMKLGEHLLLLTDKCTYRLQLADQIDPERKNPNLPFTTQQKLLDHGFGSEIVARTLLQGEKFFREGFLEIDLTAAMDLTMEAARELIAMESLARAFKAKEEKAIQEFETRSHPKSSLVLPTLGDVRGDCKTFVQKADHLSSALLAMVRLFLPEMKAEGWEHLPKVAAARYPDDPGVKEFVERILPSFQLMRDARNCLEHRLEGVTTTDFAVRADGSVTLPLFQINFKKSKYDPAHMSDFMLNGSASFLNTFEQVIAMLCAKEVKAFAGMPIVVDKVPERFREGWGCRYAYGMIYADGNFVPIG